MLLMAGVINGLAKGTSMKTLLGQAIGRYQVVAELGRGQHSVVYKAWQPSLQRYVTLKVLNEYKPEVLHKFQEEARLTASLKIPNIRQIYETDRSPEGYLYVAMEYVDSSLKQFLRHRRQQKQPLSRQEATRLLRPIAQVLDNIHRRQLVHLDIKPENILLFNDGRAVLADFGITQRVGSKTHAGTPLYASPEQAAGDRPVGPWTDIYSLGVVLYEMLAGRPPFLGDNDAILLRQHLEDPPPPPHKFNPALSRDLDRVILRALAKRPKDRYRTAGEMIEALERQPNLSMIILQRTSTIIGRRPIMAALALGLVMTVPLITWQLWPGVGSLFSKATPTATSTMPATTRTPTIVATATRIAPTEGRPTTKPVVTAGQPTVTPRPTHTATPTSQVTATATDTAVPTSPPSPTPPPSLPAPTLREPGDGAEFSGRETHTNLVWYMDYTLKADERYGVKIWRTGTKSEMRVTNENWVTLVGPPNGEVGTYNWNVRVVRVNQSNQVVAELGLPSETRRFTWR